MSIKLNKNLLDYLQNLHYINFREGKLVLNILYLVFILIAIITILITSFYLVHIFLAIKILISSRICINV